MSSLFYQFRKNIFHFFVFLLFDSAYNSINRIFTVKNLSVAVVFFVLFSIWGRREPQGKEKYEAQPPYELASAELMTWEIVAGILTLLAAFISVVSAAVKINRAIVLLVAAVKELKEHMKSQDDKELRAAERLDRLDRRVVRLESRSAGRQVREQQQF